MISKNNTLNTENNISIPPILPPFFIKSLRIIAISLIVISLLSSIAFITSGVYLGQPLTTVLTIPGLLLLIPGIMLLFNTCKRSTTLKHKKSRYPVKSPTPAKITTPEQQPSPIRSPSTSPLDLARSPSTGESDLPPQIIKTREFFQTLFPRKIHSTETLQSYSSEGTDTIFCFAKGNIAVPVFPLLDNEGGTVFNNTDPLLNPGGSGNNAVLSSAVTKKSWNSTIPKKGPKQLLEGEISIGDWESSEEFKEHWKSQQIEGNVWTQLGQIVAPTPEIQDYNPLTAFPIIKNMYKTMILKGRTCNSRTIQLPMTPISSLSFHDRPELESEWRAMVARSLFEAVFEASTEHYHYTMDNLRIVVVDNNCIPYQEYLH